MSICCPIIRVRWQGSCSLGFTRAAYCISVMSVSRWVTDLLPCAGRGVAEAQMEQREQMGARRMKGGWDRAVCLIFNQRSSTLLRPRRGEYEILALKCHNDCRDAVIHRWRGPRCQVPDLRWYFYFHTTLVQWEVLHVGQIIFPQSFQKCKNKYWSSVTVHSRVFLKSFRELALVYHVFQSTEGTSHKFYVYGPLKTTWMSWYSSWLIVALCGIWGEKQFSIVCWRQ